MINKEYLEVILHDEQRISKIHPTDMITSDILKLLETGNRITRDACFARVTGNQKNIKYKVEFLCPVCGNYSCEEYSKQEILDYLDKKFAMKCSTCINNKNNEESLTEEEVNVVATTTLLFIEKYLTPTKANVYEEYADAQISAFKRYLRIVDEDKVAEFIKAMSYENFLQTMYWKSVSYIVKENSGHRCQLCSGSDNLAVHHNTYKNHGYEHREQCIKYDLTTLCETCHSKFHKYFEK